MLSIEVKFSAFKKLSFAFICASAISACSSSSPTPDAGTGIANTNAGDQNTGDQVTNPGQGSNGDQVTNSNFPTTGTYDLSEYLFHRNVLTDGGSIAFKEKVYGKQDPEGDGAFIGLDRTFVNSAGTIQESSNSELIKTFVINATSIDELILDSTDTRIAQRFVEVGDTFMNADSKPAALGPNSVQQNATCILLEHLASFDLSSATGDRNLTSGVYDDVLKIECVTGFIQNGAIAPHTTMRQYMAKDVGIVFNEGNVLFLDDVYIIEEY